MDKKKLLITGGVLAVAGVLYFLLKSKSTTTATAVADTALGTTATGEVVVPSCARGLVKCPTSDVCYDPNVNYIIDPCGKLV